MEENKPKNHRGGRREGAGRPGSNSKLYTFRAPGTITGFIDRQDNKTEFFKDCIIRRIKEESRGISKLGEVYPISRLKDFTIPFFDIGLVAGFPIPLDNDEHAQHIDFFKMLCPHPESSYLIRVQGESMIDAGVNSGDIVIVDRSNRTPDETQISVCEFNGEYTLKRFVKRDGVGWLVPANPDFPDMKVTSEDDFNIWGTVIYIIHKPHL